MAEEVRLDGLEHGPLIKSLCQHGAAFVAGISILFTRFCLCIRKALSFVRFSKKVNRPFASLGKWMASVDLHKSVSIVTKEPGRFDYAVAADPCWPWLF